MTSSTDNAVRTCAIRARQSSPALERATDADIDTALRGMAERLRTARDTLVSANEEDLAAAVSAGMSPALQDRLRLTGGRLDGMAAELRILADVPHEPRDRVLEERPDQLTLLERRRPVGVIGANFEARPNVTLDIASQFLKSRNAGVLRTGSAALRSSRAIVEHVIAPALADAGLDPDAVQLVPGGDRSAAYALVSLPELIPLVILRGSGDSTRDLGREAARHGVRTLAHADGGGVLYIHPAADDDTVHRLIADSLDRLGVCNRLNLLLIDRSCYDERLPGVLEVLDRLGIGASLPPHDHPRGYEWSLDPERAATVTVDAADGPLHAARIANEETSGLAAAVATEDPAAAAEFIDAYAGSGVFWNSTTRLLDGFKLLRLPETGINIDRVPGPRGPVSFRDLYLRQYVVVPSGRS
ncbi:aldehyde dehydrogenase family protein [Nonomuraea jabiensis]|uniref:Glutamate-5-semialdehyde dehydrogenase n=1 Tax=Nonomuraea jabiensis TaxID=882448 RepID=A0A7W9LET9_9ACTN|nr:aldehyde dehydrogenase family protein [Nonomuraea jabiensis]MBB5781227.1 glutamate-5-semialdehyde dehydrogenase [Nonomuraea jabiensis]